MIPLGAFSINLLSENLLLLVSMLVFAGVLVAKMGSKFGAPSLLLFLLMGLVAGPDVMGLRFDDLHLAHSVGDFALSVILFTAGLETSFTEIKPILKRGIMLSTVGVLLTVVITGSFIYATGISAMMAVLIAAVMSSTDSASVFTVLHEKKLHLKENLAPMLELESGSNDPIALTLTIILVQYFSRGGGAGRSFWTIAGTGAAMFLIQVGVGVAIGLAVGFLTKWILEKVDFPNFAITAILILSAGFFANGLSQYLWGNGLLATYVCAVTIGNRVKLEGRKDIDKFFDGIAWMMQLMMFMLLGLLAHPSQMKGLILPALGMCLFMMLVSRPVSVFICMLPFKKKMSFKAKTFVSWVGLKGAGPILCALYTVVSGLEYSTDIFNFVFLLSLFSLMLQGGSIGWMAKFLNVGYDRDPVVQTFGMEVPEEMGMMRDHIVSEEDLAIGSTLRDLHLPHGIRVMMVRRDGRFLVPHGSMQLQVGDHLLIILGESDD